jgi:hypothetical protein
MKVVRNTNRPPSPPGNIHGAHFRYSLSLSQGHSAARRIMSMKNSRGNIENKTRDLQAGSAEPQPTTPPRAPSVNHTFPNNLGRTVKCTLQRRPVTREAVGTTHFRHVGRQPGLLRRLLETAAGRNLYHDTKLSVRSRLRTVQFCPVESGWLYHAAICFSAIRVFGTIS